MATSLSDTALKFPKKKRRLSKPNKNTRVQNYRFRSQVYNGSTVLDVAEGILELIGKSLTGLTKSGCKVSMKTPLLHDVLSRALRMFNSVHQRELISSEEFQDVVTELERLSSFRMFFSVAK